MTTTPSSSHFQMSFAEAAELCQGVLIGANHNFSAVSTDTRHLAKNSLFIALKGERFDAHDFLQDAIAHGAGGCLINKNIQLDVPSIKVTDTKKALAQLAEAWRAKVEIPVAAVTGSCGKTTTKTILAAILKQVGPVLSSQKSFNNDIGLPLTLLELTPLHQYAVLEIGANHGGEIVGLTKLARPDVAIITNVSAAHLAGFGSLEGTAKAKGEIFLGLKENGIAIINQDDVFSDYWKKLPCVKNFLTFGLNPASDVSASQITLNNEANPCFQLHLPNAQFEVQLPLMGQHNVMNSLAAAAAAYAMNISAENIKNGLEAAKAVTGRLMIEKGYAGSRIIDDSYNANPLSVSAAIHVLAQWGKESILVFGDMLELGESAPQFHREVGETAKNAGIQHLYCYGPLSKYTAESFGTKAQHFEDITDLINNLRPLLSDHVTILVKGSRGMDMTRVVRAFT